MSSLITKLKELESKLDIIDDSWIPIREYIHLTHPEYRTHRAVDNHYSMWSQRLFHTRTPWSNWLKYEYIDDSKRILLINKNAVNRYYEYCNLVYEIAQAYYYKGLERYESEWKFITYMIRAYPEMNLLEPRTWMARMNRWFLGVPNTYRDASKELLFIKYCIEEFGVI